MSRSLAAWIAERGGKVPFRDFMAAALYDPDFGYYTRSIRDVGPRGDFSTSATLDANLLGNAVAGWIRAQGQGSDLPRNLIEIGAGNGSLARSVLGSLGILGRRGVRYHIVEASSPLAARQRETLGGFRRVCWHAEMASALEACRGEAMLFSNELVDAFPATLYRKENGWNELFVEVGEGRVGMTEIPTPDFSPEGVWAEGQILEEHASYREWLHGWEQDWKRGALLTIDYGDTFPALYQRRPRGTLRAYFMRQRLEAMEEILARFGKQDLTCDVNFSDLRAWGEAVGWRTDFLLSQREFIRRFGSVRKPNPAQAYLLDEEGAGGAFKVLAQAR